MLARVARLAAVGAAALAWAFVAALFIDAAGAGARGNAAPAEAVAFEDPCALREPLRTGSDRRCTFELGRPGARPLVVDLDQQWSGNVLTQWLNVREPGVVEPAHFVFARSAGVPRPARLSRLFALPSADGGEHLVYVLGRCGASVCPSSDLVVIGSSGGELRTLLSLRLGRLADVEVRERAIVALEGWFPEGAQRPEAMVARRFVWDGTGYRVRDLAMRPAPSPTATPR